MEEDEAMWRSESSSIAIVLPDLPVHSPIQAGRDGTSAVRGRGWEQREHIRHNAPASVENGTPIKNLLRQPGILLIAVGAYWTSVSCVPEFLPDALWDHPADAYAAGSGHDDQYLPSWKYPQHLISEKVSDDLGIIKTFEFSTCADVLWSCAAVPGLLEDCDGLGLCSSA